MNKTLAKYLMMIPALRKLGQNQYNQINVRKYAAAATSRFTNDWVTEQGSINKEIKQAHKNLLSRARDLAKNNDYVRGYLKRCVTNIVGPDGFKLQSRALLPSGEPDEVSNIAIESAFDEWAKRQNCTIHKTLSWIEVQKLLVTQLKRDGNILLRKVVGKSAQNSFGFALELLEIDLLDTDKNEQLKGGNAIVLGIEFNNWKQPVAYYFKSNTAADEASNSFYSVSKQTVKRVPAEEIIHHFTRDHSNQLLGVTALAQSMLTFHDLQGYDQAAIINARAGASKMGFLENQPNQMPTPYEGDGKDENGNILASFAAGEVEDIGNKHFVGWDPAYPNGEYGVFVKAILRRMATGLGVAYANWVGDLEAVNFSSMRSGLLDERDNWKDDQSSFREGVLIPIFDAWLKYAMLTGQLDIPYAEYNRVNKPEFIGRWWPWVDPRADAEAKKLMIDNNMALLSV